MAVGTLQIFTAVFRNTPVPISVPTTGATMSVSVRARSSESFAPTDQSISEIMLVENFR